jgi:hypothetical protein
LTSRARYKAYFRFQCSTMKVGPKV